MSIESTIKTTRLSFDDFAALIAKPIPAERSELIGHMQATMLARTKLFDQLTNLQARFKDGKDILDGMDSYIEHTAQFLGGAPTDAAKTAQLARYWSIVTAAEAGLKENQEALKAAKTDEEKEPLTKAIAHFSEVVKQARATHEEAKKTLTVTIPAS